MFKTKLREVVPAVLPIILLVLALHTWVEPLPMTLFYRFLPACGFLIVGMAIFLQGVEVGLQRFGHVLGSTLAQKRSLRFFVLAGFLIGILVTVAEPNLHIFAGQVHEIFQGLSPSLLILSVALGAALLILVGLLQQSLSWKLNRCLLIAYGLIFALGLFTEERFLPLAFESGSVTTGPLTVPFVLALGMGLASIEANHGGEASGFGLVSLMTVGPILSVLLLGRLAPLGDAAPMASEVVSRLPLGAYFLQEAFAAAKSTVSAVLPLFFIFLLFQVLYFKLPSSRFLRICSGFFYSCLGLTFFMTGVNAGFLPVADFLGERLGALYPNGLLAIGFFLGVVIVLAEPSVWVLTEQIEKVTGGSLSRWKVLLALATSIGLATFLAMSRLVWGIPFWALVLPAYSLAFLLMTKSSRLFTAIAFDSGAVASGVMASTFVLPFTLGAAKAMGRNPLTHAFGVVGLIAMAPLLVIQILGIISQRKPSLEQLLWSEVERLRQVYQEEEEEIFAAHQPRITARAVVSVSQDQKKKLRLLPGVQEH